MIIIITLIEPDENDEGTDSCKGAEEAGFDSQRDESDDDIVRGVASDSCAPEVASHSYRNDDVACCCPGEPYLNSHE
jgi:hypothetical protein